MARHVAFQTASDPTQFGPDQIRPRAMLALSMTALARWFAVHLVPYPRLLTDHRTAFVFTLIRLGYHSPDVRYTDADQLTVTGRLSASESGKYLSLDVDLAALDTPTRASMALGEVHADMRVVTVVEPRSLAAEPGLLPAPVLAAFQPDEIYRPDRAMLARTTTPPDGSTLATAPDVRVTLHRSHCEVADQWSFIEVIELLTAAREQLYLSEATLTAIGRVAVGAPLREMTAVFNRALYVFDSCSISTHAVAIEGVSSGGYAVAILQTLDDPAHPGSCVTAWQFLRPDPDLTPPGV